MVKENGDDNGHRRFFMVGRMNRGAQSKLSNAVVHSNERSRSMLHVRNAIEPPLFDK